MNDIKSAIERVQLAPAVTHEGLSMHPLLCPQPFSRDYLTLDEALAATTARVTEVSTGGAVPQLLLRNQGDQAVFLLDGIALRVPVIGALAWVVFDTGSRLGLW